MPGNYTSMAMGNNITAEVAGKGFVEILISVKGKPVPCILSNVLNVPQLEYQLLPVITLDKSGFKTPFHSSKCYIEKHSRAVATESMKGNLYELDFLSPASNHLSFSTT